MRMDEDKLCLYFDCEEEKCDEGGSYCIEHLIQLINCNNNHSQLTSLVNISNVCKFPGCEKGGRIIKGYCQGHYKQLLKHNYNESKLVPLGLRSIPKFCTYVDPTGIRCDREYYTKGCCTGHYTQLRRNGHDKSKLTPLRTYTKNNE